MDRLVQTVVAAVALVLGAGATLNTVGDAPLPPRTGTAVEIETLLGQIRTVPVRPDVDGYDRDCGSGDACSFGAPWTDDHRGAGGDDGCDTRNDVLAAQLTDVALLPGSDCVVATGTLADPYTGLAMSFSRSQAYRVHVDHVYPLALAWDMGAHAWPRGRRVAFANDQALNLVAASGSANLSKGDRGPDEWLPVAAGSRCAYVVRFLQVAAAYDLPITSAAADSARLVAATCPSSAVAWGTDVG